MIEPLSELDEASSQLTASWKRYVSACTALSTHCTTESSLDSTSRQTLSDRMVDALASASEHYTNAEHARSIISNARNSFAPISALPSETLAHIFQLVVNSHPCEPGMRTGQNIKLPKYPDYLSYVCSYWRNVALDTPSLWTHIDVVRNHSLTSRLLERAAVCAMRASSALLDIHIYDPFIFEKQPETSIYDFLTSITPRISSFELVPQNRRELYYGHSRLLTWFFENCLPGTLTSIAVGVGVGTGITGRIFICSPENRDDLGSSRKVVGTSSKQLEPLLLPVTSLRLHSAFFPWNHPAYHGLDELRLTSEVAIRILELDLVNIFKSSPGLRVLQLGVKILPSQNTSDYPAVPVDLPFLEVLDLAATANNQLGRLARLLAPGSRPLQVYLKILDDEVPLYGDGDELLQLFSRSKITKLYIKAERRGVWHKTARAVDDTIHPFPHLQVLALEGFDWSDSPSVQPDGVLCDCVSPATGFRLESLHIIKAEAFISSFERIALRHPAKVLTIWEAQMWMAHEYSGAKLQSALSNLAPVVRVMERPPAPEEIWL